MKNDVLEYKGYYTRIEYSADDQVLFGKIEGINDLVNFEADNAKEIENEFHSAVDDYLEYCDSIGIEPDKAYKGTFNVRIDPKVHKEAALSAFKKGISLNEFTSQAIINYLNKPNINLNFAIFQSEKQSTSILDSNNKNPDLCSNTKEYVQLLLPLMLTHVQ